jgi:hypothetical protein
MRMSPTDLADVEAKLRELQDLRESLAALLASCSGHGPLEGCPIIHHVLGEDRAGSGA